jgi:hypothetical protein
MDTSAGQITRWGRQGLRASLIGCEAAAYLDPNLAVLDGQIHLPLDPFLRTGEIRCSGRTRTWIGRSARVGGRVARSVIGARATVPAGASLVDCVVWDDVTVPDGDHRRVIFRTGGAFRIPQKANGRPDPTRAIRAYRT